MTDSALVKKQLGLSYNTARYKLNRLIIFEYAKLLGLDECFRCKKPIKDLEDFSIDHKQPWYFVDPKLFWEIKNIAYSHRSCNSASHRGTVRNG